MSLIHALQETGGANSLATRFRRARAAHVVALINKTFAERGQCRIADLGGEPAYWRLLFDRDFLESRKVHVSLFNPQPFAVDDPLFSAVVGDACDLSDHADQSFDLVHSNSVVEHVGDWPRMEAFARECRRLAPRYYVQTPYFWFPIEPHFSAPFFHWRSEQARARMLLKRGYGWWPKAADMGEAMRAVQHARLLDKAQFKFLFPDARRVDEKILVVTKSLIAIRD
jgi:hypothetical protein